MPIELKDEHIDKLAHLIAGLFTEHFCSEKINFREFTEKFDDSVRIFQGKIKAKTPELWNARSVSAEGAVPRPYDLDYFLARGADMGSGEPDTKSLIPEEKIFINKDIFRQKLAGVKFSEISPAVENKLLSDLKEESIGMNEREIMIYFNLIKLEQLGADSPSGSSSAECSQNQCVKILELIEQNICPLSSLKSINDGRTLSQAEMAAVISDNIKRGKLSGDVLLVQLGSGTPKFMKVMKNFISMVCSKWGADQEEAMQFLAAYMLFSNPREDIIKRLNLSVIIKKFIYGEAIKLKPVVYATIAFICVFTNILVSQIYEINKKFFQSPQDQKDKLLKLYNNAERLKMIINNSANFGFQKIASMRSESAETVKNFKTFLTKVNILAAEDIFSSNYSGK